MKPSEKIRAMIPDIAHQRLEKAKALQAASGPTILMNAAEERDRLVRLGQDPLSWVMAILAHLDEQEARDKANAISKVFGQ